MRFSNKGFSKALKSHVEATMRGDPPASKRCDKCGYMSCICGCTDVPDAWLTPYQEGGIGDCSCGKKNVRLVLETSWGPGSLELCWECWSPGQRAFHERNAARWSER